MVWKEGLKVAPLGWGPGTVAVEPPEAGKPAGCGYSWMKEKAGKGSRGLWNSATWGRRLLVFCPRAYSVPTFFLRWKL